MSEIEIVVPECSEDMVSEGLRYLTEFLHKNCSADVSGGFLGGEYGYGAYFENDTFMMHPYCWCEKEECPWCGGDASPFAKASYFGGDLQGGAPNFLHKPSGSKIWWYKYIGRGMEMKLQGHWNDILRDCMASIGKASGEGK